MRMFYCNFPFYAIFYLITTSVVQLMHKWWFHNDTLVEFEICIERVSPIGRNRSSFIFICLRNVGRKITIESIADQYTKKQSIFAVSSRCTHISRLILTSKSFTTMLRSHVDVFLESYHMFYRNILHTALPLFFRSFLFSFFWIFLLSNKLRLTTKLLPNKKRTIFQEHADGTA